MGQIRLEKNVGGIEGLCVITPKLHCDNRGYFVETYSHRDMKEEGFHSIFVQDNMSLSFKGVLRGLHFQIKKPQAKLIQVIRGSVFDVAVDLRENSNTYGKYYGLILDETNMKQLFIPKGFAHGFLVLSDVASIYYKCDSFYDSNDQFGIAWNDPTLSIDWPNIDGNYSGSASAAGYTIEGIPLNMSERDQNWKTIDIEVNFNKIL